MPVAWRYRHKGEKPVRWFIVDANKPDHMRDLAVVQKLADVYECQPLFAGEEA